MSRVGKQPIAIPSGTRVEIKDGVLSAEGARGRMEQQLFVGIRVEQAERSLTLVRTGDSGSERARHGLMRALIANAVQGVTEGFTRQLDIVGVGYKAEVKDSVVQFALGYSHPVLFPIPAGIRIEVDGKANRITIMGCDRQQVGQVAAEIRGLRSPDPYKGKGIRYVNEVLRRKVGKAGGK